ncbi:MAG: UDP-3-O-(3-hydroxymyristoyl)glucosamine N-acyltransferase [Armatimonadetes bacterium]|nr:UDP-3-O-(3-hydroxymyristoyl)glucosamine N-acyltransferase [Armatimonadota bacterium]
MDQPSIGWTLSELAEIVGGELCGPADLRIAQPVPAGDDCPEGITFAESPKYLAIVEATDVGAVLVKLDEANCNKPHIRCQSPREAFGRLLAITWRDLPLVEGMHATAIVSPDAKIDAGSSVGPFCVIEGGTHVRTGAKIHAFCYVGEQCRIGEGAKLYPRVTLYRDVRIGDRSIIHAGTVLGADGFGYFWDSSRHRKVPQVGGVRIEDDCEIGALTAIDRATAGNTRIGKGVKIDNLVQIAHNVEVGQDTVLAGQAGVGGSSKLGARNFVAGQVGIKDHVTITDDVTLAAKTAATADILEPGAYWGALVPRKSGLEKRIQVALSELPELQKRVLRLEAEIAELRGKA